MLVNAIVNNLVAMTLFHECIFSNRIESDTVKIGIVNFLPNS